MVPEDERNNATSLAHAPAVNTTEGNNTESTSKKDKKEMEKKEGDNKLAISKSLKVETDSKPVSKGPLDDMTKMSEKINKELKESPNRDFKEDPFKLHEISGVPLDANKKFLVQK